MTIETSLEANRAQELEELLAVLQPKLVLYVAAVDLKKSDLGTYHDPQWLKKKFTANEALLQGGLQSNHSELFKIIDDVLKYSVNTWNPGFLDKLYASNNPIGVVSDILLSMLNTNSHVYTVSPVLTVLENFIGKKYAKLFFNDLDRCGGLTFSGGLYSNITAMHMARSLKFPETKALGNGSYKFAIYTSSNCHYSVVKSAILLGLGKNNVFKIPINSDGTMNIDALQKVIVESIEDGFTPLLINATAGTTVFGLYDDLVGVGALAKKYNTWFHVDGSWGGNVVFSEKRRGYLKGIEAADSITTNPHKMLGVPNTCSFLLVADVNWFTEANSLEASYLFHSREEGEDNVDLADGTMGCGRRADSFKFYLAWLYYGYDGFQERVDHAYDIVAYFVDTLKKHPQFELVTDSPQCLQVCFYYRPKNFKDEDFTPVTRFVSRELHKRAKYLVDFSTNPLDAHKGEFFRVVFNLPIITDKIVDDLVATIVDAGEGQSWES